MFERLLYICGLYPASHERENYTARCRDARPGTPDRSNRGKERSFVQHATVRGGALDVPSPPVIRHLWPVRPHTLMKTSYWPFGHDHATEKTKRLCWPHDHEGAHLHKTFGLPSRIPHP